jgi:hypothetical protein
LHVVSGWLMVSGSGTLVNISQLLTMGLKSRDRQPSF